MGAGSQGDVGGRAVTAGEAEPGLIVRSLYGGHCGLSLRPELDEMSGLPRKEAGEALMRLTLNHLALPYSVVEYGCGQKASIILNLLRRSGLPSYALGRGMILEENLSPEALERRDEGRSGALQLDNPLYARAHLQDPMWQTLLAEIEVKVSASRAEIRAGDYVLHHRKRIQFLGARSHIFAMVRLWDQDAGRVVCRVLDPSLDPQSLFEAEAMRERLGAAESLLLEAPLLGEFRLCERWLTERQRERLAGRGARRQALRELDREEHAAMIRELTGAQAESLGDPLTWTYLNNVEPRGQAEHRRAVARRTGSGELLRPLIAELGAARAKNDVDGVAKVRGECDRWEAAVDLRGVMEEDAALAERSLAPLARVMFTISYADSLKKLARYLREGKDLALLCREEERWMEMHGLGVRLRTRLGVLARLARDERGRIDAGTFTHRHFLLAKEIVRQMNWAGLSVFVDRVGNLHGLPLTPEQRAELAADSEALRRWMGRALAFVSYLDTDPGASPMEGGLGAAGGIEVLHLFADLRRWFRDATCGMMGQGTLMVSVFVGGARTFANVEISQPGAAAVEGSISSEDVYGLRDAEGRDWKGALGGFLRELACEAGRGELRLAHPLRGEDVDTLIGCCFPPTCFRSAEIYERHLEDGDRLREGGVPAVLAKGVMGWQRDELCFRGGRSGEASLSFIQNLVRRCKSEGLRNGRLSVRRPRDGFAGTGGESSPEKCEGAIVWRVTFRRSSAITGERLPEEESDLLQVAGRLPWREEARQILGGFRDGAEAWCTGVMELKPCGEAGWHFRKLSLGIGADVTSEEANALEAGLRDAGRRLSKDPGCRGVEVAIDRIVEEGVARPNEVRLEVEYRSPDEGFVRAVSGMSSRVLEACEARECQEARRRCLGHAKPMSLERGNIVVQLERRFRGSHRQGETTLAADLLRGQLLQLAIASGRLEKEARDIRAITEAMWPPEWTIDGRPVHSSGTHMIQALVPGNPPEG